jgi:hypothetical protein
MYWRRVEKISWTIRRRNEVLTRVKEEWNIFCTVKQRKAKWIGYILQKNCSLTLLEERRNEKTRKKT